MRYIYDHPDWPAFRWDKAVLSDQLADLRFRQGRFIARMEGLGFDLRDEAILESFTDDAVKTSEIEGETLDARQVRSSVTRRLGMDRAGLVPSDRGVDGIVDMLLDATRNYVAPLTPERLFLWHSSLFPSGRSGLRHITVGAWRRPEGGEMQVVSGLPGREVIHLRAPAAERVAGEMAQFLAWFEDRTITIDPVVKAAVAHIWFVTIHPFDDGNGRIARAIADLALARAKVRDIGSTVSRRACASSARPITRRSKPRRRAISTSPPGCAGSLVCSTARWAMRRSGSKPSCVARGSGPRPRRAISTRASARS